MAEPGDVIDRMARAMHERNRILQSADCLAHGHEIPHGRFEFMHYDDLPDYAKGLLCDIASHIRPIAFNAGLERAAEIVTDNHYWDVVALAILAARVSHE